MAEEFSYKKDDGTWLRGRAAAKAKREYEEAQARELEIQQRINEVLTEQKRGRGHQKGEARENYGVYGGDPDDNARYMKYAREVALLPKFDNRDKVLAGKRCDEFFRICEENGMKPSFAQLAVACGFSREQFGRICRGEMKTFPSETAEVYSRYYHIIEAMLETYAQDGKINPVPFIFLAKNNYGYRDQVEHVVTAGKQVDSAEKLIAEARMLGLTDGSIEIDGDDGSVE